MLRALALAGLLLAISLPSSAADAVDRGAAFREGVGALRARDFKSATAALTRAAGEHPRDAEVWMQLGRARSGAQDWDGAIEAYRKVAEIDPKNAVAWHNIGNAYFRQGDIDRANEHYTRALALRPDYLLAAFHQGWALRQANRSEEAESVLRRCLEMPARSEGDRTTQADCLFGLGTLRHRAGEYAQAAAMFEQVRSIFPEHAEVHYYLGMAYRQLGRIDEAQRELALHERLLDARRKAIGVIESPLDP